MPLILTERNRQQALKDQKDLISTTKELVKLKEEYKIIDEERLENWIMMAQWRKKWIQCDDERYKAKNLSPRSPKKARKSRKAKRKTRRKSRKAKRKTRHKSRKAKRKTRCKSRKARRTTKK